MFGNNKEMKEFGSKTMKGLKLLREECKLIP